MFEEMFKKVDNGQKVDTFLYNKLQWTFGSGELIKSWRLTKQTKWPVHPVKTQESAYLPSLIRVFAVRFMGS